MSTAFRRVARIGLVAVLVLVAGIVGAVYLRSDALRRHITPLLEARVGGILGSPVRIRDFHRVGPGREELAVQVMEQDGSSPLLDIDSLQITYLLAPILKGDIVITDVRAEGVGIHVRRASNDELNVAALVDAVSAEDEGGGLPIETFVGSIRLERVAVIADGVISGLNIAIPDLAIDSVIGTPVPLSDTRPFALHADEWTITRGEHSQTLAKITASGTVNVDRVDITDGLLTADGTRVSVHGRVAFTPSVDLTVDGVVSADTVRPLYPDELRDARGSVELDGLRITGDLGDPVVEGPWAFRDALWGQVLVAAGAGALRWQGGDAVLRNVEISIFGGSAVASVQVDDLGTGALEIEATATHLDIARLREAFAPSAAAFDAVAGKLDGTLVATLRDDGLRSTGKWDLRGVAWNGTAVGDGLGSATHHIDGGQFEAHVTLAGDTRAALSGPLPGDESLDIDISFTAQDVGPVARAFGQDAQGSVRGEGRITGSTDEPGAEAQATLSEGAWRGLPISQATAEFRWQDETLHVLSSSVRSGDGAVVASGTVTLAADGSRPPRFEFAARATAFQLDPYVAVLSPRVDFSAAVNGHAHVTGSLESYDGEATLSLANATYVGVPIALDSVEMTAAAGRWTAAPFEFRVSSVPFDAAATFDVETYAFSAAFPAAIPISDLLTWLPNASEGTLEDAEGFVRLAAEGEGSFSSPVAHVTAHLSDARFRSARLGDSDATFTYEDGAITGDGALVDGAYALALAGEVTSEGVPFEASIAFADTDVLPLIRLAGQPAGKGLSSTTVGGEVIVTGDFTRWREALASVDLSSLRLRTPEYELTNVDPVRGSISASGIDLSPIVMNGTDPAHPFHVEVRGLLDLHKPIAFDVDARNFDLDMVSDFMGLPGLAKGVGTYRLDVEGTAAEPVVKMSWDIPNARIALRDGTPPLDIENVQGEAEYRDRVVTLRRMSMRLGGRDVDVSGEIPMALTFVLVPLVEQLLDAPLRLTVTTQQDDLSWLPSLHPLLQEADGSASVTLDVTGSIRRPRVSGSAQVNASRVALDFSNRPVENILVTASFSSDDAGRVVADVESRALVGDGRIVGSGSFTYPLDLVNWRSAFDLDKVRGIMDFGLDGLMMSRLVEFAGGEAPPIEVEMSGSAHLDVTGADPRRWTGSVKLSDAGLSGNDRLLPVQGPIAASYDGSTLRLDACRFGMGPQLLSLSGALHEDRTWEGRAEATSLDVTILGDFLTGPMYPRGQLTATVSVGGSPAAPTMDAEWYLRDLIYDRFELSLFEGSATYADGMLTLPQWDLESFGNHMTVAGSAPLEVGVEDGALRVARPDLPMSLTLKTEEFDISFASLLFPSVSEASGKALIDLTINGTSLHPNLVGRVQMPDAALTLAHNGMRLDGMQAYIDARPGRIDVDKFRFDVGPARYDMVRTSLHLDLDVLQTSMTVTNGSAEAWFPAPADGADSVATLVTGTVAAHVDVAGLRREGLFKRAVTGSELFERAVRLTSHVQGQAQLSSLRVGWLGYDLSNDPDTPVELTFDKGLLTLDQVELRQLAGSAGGRHGSMSASGEWEIGSDLDVRVEGRLGAAFISDWLAEHVFTQPGQTAPAAEGSFDYAIHVTGPDTDPRASMSMTSSDLALGKLRLDSIAATASYRDEVLTLDDCQLTASGSLAKLRGSMPFEVSLYEAKARPRDADMQMQFDATLPNADILPLLFPFIGRADGTGEAHMSIGGRLDDPIFGDGIPGRPAISLRGLRLDVPASNLVLSGVEVAISARGDRFQIDQLDGVANQGMFSARGTIGLTRGMPTSVDISLIADAVRLAKPPLYRALGDATLRMHGLLERVQIDGEVTLSNLNYRRDWMDLVRESLESKALIALREGARFQYPVVRGMVVDLQVHADAEDVAFDTGAGKVGGDIDGQIVGPLTELIFYGDVRRMQGEFAYRGHRFEIDAGYAVNGSTTVFNPRYEITATSMETLRGVRVIDTQGNRHDRDVDVTISVSGTLEQPSPEFDITVLNQGPGEDYAMTPTECIALLTVGSARPQATGDALSNEFVDIVGGRVGSYIGVTEVEVELDPDAPEETRIQFTKELSDRVVVTYGSTFQVGQEQRLEIDYQLDRHIGISGERNEEGKYGVDLKLEYEFR
jgi:autotransporter translocation and assembly factor TamB